jgi:hypothetical protein
LTGRKLQQRFTTYKDRYQRAKDFENNTGAGLLDTEGYESVAEKLDGICPCYDRMNALFGTKPNVVPMGMFDSTGSIELNDVQILNADEDNSTPDNQNRIEGSPTEIPSPRNTDTHPNDKLPSLSEISLNSTMRNFRPSDSQNGNPPGDSLSLQTSSESQAAQNTQTEGSPPSSNQQQHTIPNVHRSISSSHATSTPSSQSSQSGNSKPSTLAGAFEAANTARMRIMDKQLALDKKRFNLEVDEQKEAHNKRQQDVNDCKESLRAVEKWLQEGKSPLDIQILIQTVFGS